MDLTDEQWSVIRPLIPELTRRRKDGKGRPWRDSREVMNGIVWILRTGACWYDMPDRYPPYQTCHRSRFQLWVRSGVFRQILEALANDLRDRGGGIDLSECYIDGMFIVAKKGEGVWGERPSAAKVRSSWQWQTILAFLSPFTLRLLLRRMKSPPLLKRLSPSVLSLMNIPRV